MKLISLNHIFDIEYGNQFDFSKMAKVKTGEYGINFVSRSSKNFGIMGKVKKDISCEPYGKGLITVTLGGSYLLASFIQPDRFYTAQNIKVLKPKQILTFNEKLFYCLCIQQNRFRYSSHGREANVSIDNLLVPKKMPSGFSKLFLNNTAATLSKSIGKNRRRLENSRWEYFKLSDLFEITGSRTTSLKKLHDYGQGRYPYITTRATNNGVKGFYNFYTDEGNILTVDSAVLGYCSYQSLNFSASDHVEKLIPNFQMNKYIALFLVTILNLEQYRYNYGRKCCQDRMKQISIRLPAKDNQPDYEFMEAYVKSLPYSSSL